MGKEKLILYEEDNYIDEIIKRGNYTEVYFN